MKEAIEAFVDGAIGAWAMAAAFAVWAGVVMLYLVFLGLLVGVPLAVVIWCVRLVF